MKTHTSESAFASKRGGVLLTAVIFSTISLVTIASFLRLTNHEVRLSNHQFYSNQSLNLAEAGLDEAMYLLNAENTTGWTLNGSNARLTVTGMEIGRGATGEIHVLVEDWEGDPEVTAEGRVTSGSGMTSTKQVRMTLRPRSYFANGITARCRIRFAGGGSEVESYRSSEGFMNSPEYVRRDRAAVATTALESAIHLGNGFIWGYAFTGGGEIDVGPHGTVQGEDSNPTPRVDPKRVARDFSAIFPRPEQEPSPSFFGPTIELAALEEWIAEKDADEDLNWTARPVEDYVDAANLAREADPDGDGTYIVNYGSITSSTTIGIPAGLRIQEHGGSHPTFGGRLVVYVDRINMSGNNNDIRIVGPVTLVVTGEISMSGGSRFIVGYDSQNVEEAEVRIYALGDVSVSGSGGLHNRTNIPNNLAIFGMGDDATQCNYSQSFNLGGNGQWEAVVYAPNADITLNGGGSSGHMAGAVVGMNVTINGGSKFHYDEDTEAFLRGFGFAMESWEEVRKVDRISFN